MTDPAPQAEDPDYDGTWRKLFEQPSLVRDLLSLLARELPPLEGANIRPTNTTFMTRHLQRKHTDCIWHLPLRGHPDPHRHPVFLMVEFQSSVQHTMPARMLDYCVQLFLHLFNTRGEDRDLTAPWPMIVPLVLYNGKHRWTAPDHLLAPGAQPLLPRWAALQPQGGFQLWDLGHDEIPTLEDHPDNLALILFWLERVTLQGQPERVDALFERLQHALERHPDRLALQEAFLIFFNAVLRLRGATLPETRLEHFREVKHMFHHLAEACEEKGRREGRQEGRQEGRLDTALTLLRLKFGASEEQWRPRLEALNIAQFEDFLLRAAVVHSLDELDG